MSAHSAVEEPPRSRQLCPKDHFHLHSQPSPDLGGGGGGGGDGGGGTVLYCMGTFRGWFVPRIYGCFIALPTNPLFRGVTHSIGGELSLPQGIP